MSDQLQLSLQNRSPLSVGVDCWAQRVETLIFHCVGLINQRVWSTPLKTMMVYSCTGISLRFHRQCLIAHITSVS